METISAGYAYSQLRTFRRTERDWKVLADHALKLYGKYMCIPDDDLETDYVKYMIISDAIARNYLIEQLEDLDGVQ